MNNEKILSNLELLDITAGSNFLPGKDNIDVTYYGIKSLEKPKPKVGNGRIITVYSIGPSQS